ncbi:MAG: NAD(P)H-dependent oxidoreductase [Actinomycetota bacterium]|nr:NAD(P)H-dependent oxidoreductase [Actinomycetota bacterium]
MADSGTGTNPKIGVIIGTTRQGRFGEKPARWIRGLASRRSDLDFEVVDLRDYPLPLFDEATGPAMAPPEDEVALRFGEKMDRFDGYVFVTAEYNHSIPAVLKNALDHVYPQCNRKPAAFVGYGTVGGARAVEQLRLVCVELQMAPTRTAVHVGFETFSAVMRGDKDLADFDRLNRGVAAMLDELSWWTRTLKAGRDEGESRGRERTREGSRS